MKKTVLLLVMMSVLQIAAFAWNRTAHEAIAAIAEEHLKPSVKAEIEKYLDGRSIVYYATWMDHKHDHTPYKHTVTVNSDNTLVEIQDRPDLDGMNAIDLAIDRLVNRDEYPADTAALYLKYIVHLIADIHCPAHIVYPGVKRFFNVTIMGKPNRYHPVWDGILDYNHQWTYNEYVEQVDRYSKKEIKDMSSGTPEDWAHEVAIECRTVYEWAEEGSELDRDFVNKAYPFAESLMIRASYRLAALLNDIFS